MTQAKLGTVQIRHTLLDGEVLSSRVKTESIQYEFMTVVISSLRKLARTKWHHIVSPQNLPCEYCVAAPVRHFDQQHL